MSEKEYIIFCDESDKQGRFYSDFFGGVLVGASQYERITEKLTSKKQELNLYGEVKWSKVTDRYLPKYEQLVQCFFEEIITGSLKIRIMFTQNAVLPQGLTKDDLELRYYKLYYQFIKHAFGLQYMDHCPDGIYLRLYFDQFPDSGEKVEQFKGFLLALQHYKAFREVGISIRKEDITEVLSHEHVILQCLDIVLGSMSFRLNDKHKEKIPGERIRASRTRAKEKLYKLILSEIQRIKPNFNIGISTGIKSDISRRWTSPYSHWLFRPSEFEFDSEHTKGALKKK